MPLTTFALRILASMIAGGFIGLERQRSNKSAGIRTNTLVAVGACMYVLVDVSLMRHPGTDPSRIIGQIVTGIGFLGAGVIILVSFGLDFTDSCGSAIACINAVGPGLGTTGAVGNYAHLHDVSKWTLSVLMLMGRLEFFAVLIVLSPK